MIAALSLILFSLIACTLLGGMIGWLLRGQRASATEPVLIAVENRSEADVQDQSGALSKLQDKLNVVESQLTESRAELESMTLLKSRLREAEDRLATQGYSVSQLDTNLTEIYGLDSVDEERLVHKAGIRSREDLVSACTSNRKRAELATKTGISIHDLSKWAHLVDMMNLPGLDLATVNRLAEAGYSSISELGRARIEVAYPRIVNAFAAAATESDAPLEPVVNRWIEEAKTAPRQVS